eukprot:CAMPEP_0170090986 /NCGR_PEP_ID=MMETSP0019_2-20121128/24701_1 /TAXON_ID=98059 /ORGANISM="Dinobryon sp., Strain UTEXLB2267" /LENGTH=327 /DNA_ID=CAMNT_0010310659 /DNA_START=559 /DNA_END=1539 /DNA_ORIENTATION=-
MTSDKDPLWPQERINQTCSRPSGVFSSKIVTLAGNFTYKIVLLDTRSNKDPVGTVEGDFLGEEQWQWLEMQLLESDHKVDLILLGSSIQILPLHKLLEESWSAFPSARQRLLRLVASARPPVVLLSGDVHMAEASKALCTATTANSTRKFDLWEFTSSGLSHTFTKVIGSGPKPSEGGLLQVSRGWIHELLWTYYQWIYPAAYRENKMQDVYRAVHFSLLDLLFHPIDGSHGLLYRTVDHTGHTVMSKYLPIPLRTDTSPHHLNTINSDDSADDSDSNSLTVECKGVKGQVSIARLLLYRAAVAGPLMLFVVCPLVAVIWFVLAAVW